MLVRDEECLTDFRRRCCPSHLETPGGLSSILGLCVIGSQLGHHHSDNSRVPVSCPIAGDGYGSTGIGGKLVVSHAFQRVGVQALTIKVPDSLLDIEAEGVAGWKILKPQVPSFGGGQIVYGGGW